MSVVIGVNRPPVTPVRAVGHAWAEGKAEDFKDNSRMESAQYTLPGVMHFLRTEWQQRERARIEWEVERADLRSRVSRLESEKHQLQHERDALQRRVDLLSIRIRDPENLEMEAPPASHEPSSATTQAQEEASVYIEQCLADMKHVLHQFGIENPPSQVQIPTPELLKDYVTLANFGNSASSVLVLNDNRVLAGTIDGDLLLWASGSTNAKKFGTNEHPVLYLAQNEAKNVVFAASGSKVQVFDVAGFPKLKDEFSLNVEGGDLTIEEIATFGDLVALVHSDGYYSTWKINDDLKIEALASSEGSSRACGFITIDESVRLVLARDGSSSTPNANVALVDPVSGQVKKQIVLPRCHSVSAMACSQDMVAIGSSTGDLRVVNVLKGEAVADVPSGHQGEITSLSLFKNSNLLLSTSIDGRVLLWEFPHLVWKGRFLSHDSGYGALCSSANETTAVVGGGDGIIRVYPPVTSE